MGAEDMQMIEEFVDQIYSPQTLAILILTAALCFVFARYGFKLLRIEIAIMGAAIGYTLGSVELSALIGDLVPIAKIDIILGVAAALVGALISMAIYKLVVFIYVGIFAFVLALPIFSGFITGISGLPIDEDVFAGMLSLLFAIVAAYIVRKFFKPLFIIFTSLGNTALGLGIIAMLISPDNTMLIGGAALAGLILGIPAMIKQFKTCKDIEF